MKISATPDMENDILWREQHSWEFLSGRMKRNKYQELKMKKVYIFLNILQFIGWSFMFVSAVSGSLGGFLVGWIMSSIWPIIFNGSEFKAAQMIIEGLEKRIQVLERTSLTENK